MTQLLAMTAIKQSRITEH